MKKIITWIFIVLIVIVSIQWWREYRLLSDILPLSQYEKVFVHVWFSFPDGSEYYLGRTKGASSCGRIAYDYAYSNKLENNLEWSYVCCTEEGGSDCYRKIR